MMSDPAPNCASITARSAGPAFGCSSTSSIDDARLSGSSTDSPSISTDVRDRRSRLEAPTSTTYSPPSTTQPSTRTSQ